MVLQISNFHSIKASIFWALLKKLAIALIEPGSFSINIEPEPRKKRARSESEPDFMCSDPSLAKTVKVKDQSLQYLCMREVIGMHLLKGYGSLFP